MKQSDDKRIPWSQISALQSLKEGHALPLIFVMALLLISFIKCLNAQMAIAGTVGFAMDDAWIHVAVARNFATGLGWGIVPGKTLAVSTSPTWTLLLSVFFLFFSNPIKITLLCSLISMSVAAIFCYLLAFRLTENRLLGILASSLLIISPISLWGLVSGLELPLALAGFMLALYLYYISDPDSKLRRIWVPVALAFAAITRPELFILIPIAIIDTFYANFSGTRKLAWKTLITQVLTLILALSPYFAFNLYSHGKIFPATYYAKTMVRGVGLMAALKAGDMPEVRNSLVKNPLVQISSIIDELKNDNLPVLLLLSIGVLAFTGPFSNSATRRGMLLPLALLIIPYAMGVSAPSKDMSNHAGRYFVIFPPMAILLACLGLKLIYKQSGLRILPMIAVFFMLWFPYKTAPSTLRHIGIDAESTQKLYVEMPTWIRDNLDPKAVLAVNDIGGLGYFTSRDMIDVMGLATPEIWPAIFRKPGRPIDVKKMREFLREKKVDYVILSPRYYPELTSDKNTFEPIKEWREGYEHGRLISPQILYKVHWG